MKKYILLVISIVSFHSCVSAQHTSSDKENSPFYVPAKALLDSFHIRLDEGNSLEVELSDLEDMKKVYNMDSVITAVKKNFSSIKDSFSNPMSIKSIRYVTDESGRTFIRLRKFIPDEKNYMIADNKNTAMKIRQDTVKIIKIIPEERTPFFSRRYVVLTFYLNDYHQLYQYGNHTLDSALMAIYSAASKVRKEPKDDKKTLTGSYTLSDTLSSKKPDIHFLHEEKPHFYLTLLLGGNLQNVYQSMAPSLTLGILLGLPRSGVNHQLKLVWEPMFLFEKDKNDILKTYRNGWLMIGYQAYAKGKNKFLFSQAGFSFSYLVRNRGNIFHKNTFRLGLGGVGMDDNRIFIQPIIYFHDFFRDVTPGLRLSVSL